MPKNILRRNLFSLPTCIYRFTTARYPSLISISMYIDTPTAIHILMVFFSKTTSTSSWIIDMQKKFKNAALVNWMYLNDFCRFLSSPMSWYWSQEYFSYIGHIMSMVNTIMTMNSTKNTAPMLSDIYGHAFLHRISCLSSCWCSSSTVSLLSTAPRRKPKTRSSPGLSAWPSYSSRTDRRRSSSGSVFRL